MSKSGGFITGPWWQYDDDLDKSVFRRFCVAWGEIVKDPEDLFEHGARVIRFVIKTGRGADRTERHLVCVGYGKNIATAVMRAMEKHDYVVAFGTWVDNRDAGTKKDKKTGLTRKRKNYEFRVGFLIPAAAIAALVDMCVTPEIMRMVDNFRNSDADPWEE